MKNHQPKSLLMALADSIKPSLRYDGTVSVEEWQKTAREKLIELLGLQYMLRCDYNFEVEEVKEYDGFTQKRFTFQSEPGYYVVCYIRIPKGVGKIAPMICIQGHSKGQHLSLGEPKYSGDEEKIKDGDRDFCRHALANGFAAVTMDQRYMGENGGTENGPSCCLNSDGKANALPTLLFGRTAIGERVWDIMNLINVLGENFSELDMEKVACMGQSGGGTATVYAGAVDERIKTVIPSGSVCAFKDSIIDIHHCACNYVPQIARYFDMSELCGLVAPRKLIIVAGKDDPIFPRNGVQKVFDIAKETYEAAGAEENIAVVYGDGGHRFYAKSAYEQYHKMK